MPSTFVAEKFALLTANGGATGLLTIASNTGWLPGCTINLISSGQVGLPLVIVAQVGSTQIRCRRADSLASNGRGNTFAAYTTVQSASVNMEGQVVPVMAPFTPRESA